MRRTAGIAAIACLACTGTPAGDTVAERFAPPAGFARVEVGDGTFGAWLRRLPLKPGRPMVRLYDGLPKPNPFVHVAVVDLDVGERDLQQCADAVIRLRAEYLLEAGRDDEIAFRFTSGDEARWDAWREGMRPSVSGSRVTWSRTAAPDASYESFRRYLDVVFTYAGSRSLARDLAKVDDPAGVEIGDVFVQGGSPGHAVIVVDVAGNGAGERRFLLAQSYMPAQEIHVLKGPDGPWYPARSSGVLETPEWTFRYEDLRRFR